MAWGARSKRYFSKRKRFFIWPESVPKVGNAIFEQTVGDFGFRLAPKTINRFPSASLPLPLSHFLNQPEFDKGSVKEVFDPGARRSTWMVGANENVEVLGKSDGAV